jgi:hypothetical protein
VNAESGRLTPAPVGALASGALSQAEREELMVLTWRAVADLPFGLIDQSRYIELEARRQLHG